ncbi:MAG: type II secretion system F family protein, partial [Jatrophihabitantaceae bacterium]
PREPAVRRAASTLWLSWCAAWAAAGVGLAGAALGVAATVAAATTAMMISSALARRREVRRRRGLLTAVRLVVAELAAGSRPDSALGAAAAVAPEYAAVLAAAASAARCGAEVSDVLLSSGVGELEPLAHAWRVGERAGAPMAEVLGRVAADLADQGCQHRAVGVALAGPRSSAVLLAGLPVIGIALGAAMGARPLAVLLGSPAGRMLCCVGVLLDAAGVLWTQFLTQRAQRP